MDDIARVIRHHKNTTFVGVVTDNTSTNKKAWRVLPDTFPSCCFQGCTSHGCYLLVKDVFGAAKTEEGNCLEATYPLKFRPDPQ